MHTAVDNQYKWPKNITFSILEIKLYRSRPIPLSYLAFRRGAFQEGLGLQFINFALFSDVSSHRISLVKDRIISFVKKRVLPVQCYPTLISIFWPNLPPIVGRFLTFPASDCSFTSLFSVLATGVPSTFHLDSVHV